MAKRSVSTACSPARAVLGSRPWRASSLGYPGRCAGGSEASGRGPGGPGCAVGDGRGWVGGGPGGEVAGYGGRWAVAAARTVLGGCEGGACEGGGGGCELHRCCEGVVVLVLMLVLVVRSGYAAEKLGCGR